MCLGVARVQSTLTQPKVHQLTQYSYVVEKLQSVVYLGSHVSDYIFRTGHLRKNSQPHDII